MNRSWMSQSVILSLPCFVGLSGQGDDGLNAAIAQQDKPSLAGADQQLPAYVVSKVVGTINLQSGIKVSANEAVVGETAFCNDGEGITLKVNQCTPNVDRTWALNLQSTIGEMTIAAATAASHRRRQSRLYRDSIRPQSQNR